MTQSKKIILFELGLNPNITHKDFYDKYGISNYWFKKVKNELFYEPPKKKYDDLLEKQFDTMK